MDKINANRIEFLYASIKDAQELIRFIDTKTAFVITIIGAFIIAVFSSLRDLTMYYCLFNQAFKIELILLLMALVICIYAVIRIIYPTHNPSDNLIQGKLKSKVKFFIPENIYHKHMTLLNLKKHKLNHDLDEYIDELMDSSENDLIISLSNELFKISYTRNIKNDRFRILIILITITTGLFILEHLTYLSQLEKILANGSH